MTEAVSRTHNAPIKVSELTRYLKYLVEQDDILTSLSVQGEVCEFSRSAAGHTYFALKDASSQVSCVLFRHEAVQQVAEIAEVRKGVSVIVHGYLTVYEPRGNCQIYVQRVLVQGQGALFQRVERLKAKLECEGLFAVDRKRPIPHFPRKIALVTSPRSQAYHDVLRRLSDQYPYVTVIEAGASVQGDGAADEMAMAIDIVNRLTDCDVILLVRGGGAPEDLAAFNDERLARAIFASRIPVISGVGHETDHTIVDFVADLRAPTPSLAAAAAVPDMRGLAQRAVQLHRTSTHAIHQRLRLDRRRWFETNRSLLHCSPENRLRTQRLAAAESTRSLQRATRGHLSVKRARLEALQGQLRALDPLAILARGYAVLTDLDTGAVISTIDEATAGRSLRAQVADGEFLVRVDDG